MVTANEDQIGDALDFEITDWRETQRNAINNINWPPLPDNSAMFTSAAMFNFGVDATKTIYPSSVAAGIISCTSVQLFILQKAAVAFRAQYQAAVDRANGLLRDQFIQLSDSFVREIQGICRNFKNSREGREMASHICRETQGIQFRDDRQRDALLRQLIRDANLIETDPTVIRTNTNAGVTRLCVKIRDLWRASYHDALVPDAQLWYSGSSQLHMFGNGSVGQERTLVRRREDQDWIIRNAWRMDVRYYPNSNPFNNRRDQCYATLARDRNITQTYRGVLIGSDVLRVAISNLNRSIQQTH